MVLVFLQRGIALRIPAQLQTAFFHPGGNAPRGDFFVAVDVFDKRADDAKHRLHQAFNNREQLSSAVRQTQGQIGNPGTGPDEGQDDADQHVDQQLHHNHRRRFSGFPGDFAGWQHLQPKARGAQQQTQRRLVADQQLQLLHPLRSGLRQLDQIIRRTPQPLGKLAGVLQDLRQHPDAVPHALDRRPTPGKHAVARRRRHRLRPLRLEPLPLATQPAIQFTRQPAISGKQIVYLLGSDLTADLDPVEFACLAGE
ncbi:hypothetical protein PseAD21_28540 [Pseudomonas sp. AD21]|nr:hypothetical protein PseAD21_28540 [Pseudomonas sp. AD21]